METRRLTNTKAHRQENKTNNFFFRRLKTKRVIIQKALLANLKKSISNQDRLRLDLAVYIIGEINRIPTLYRNNDNDTRYAKIYSQRLKKDIHNYKEYMDFLSKAGFIENVQNYSTNKNESNAFQVPIQYYLDELVLFTITDKILLRKFEANGWSCEQAEKMNLCHIERPHLVKWFNERLSMDAIEAYKDIGSLRNIDDQKKYTHGFQLISEWANKAWSYSIKWDTDERLHSTLTRSNKILRKHIRYNGESIVGLDLKTSQPFFFCSILKGICKRDMSLLNRIGAVDILGEKLIHELFDVIELMDSRKFASTVVNEDLYVALAEIIPMEYDGIGKPYRMIYKKNNWPEKWVKKSYDSERDCMKDVMLQIFNCKPSFNSKEINAFTNAFPSVSKIINLIKESGIEFYKLLSHVESYCLLDYTAKKFAAENPNVFLLSIHDSLVTTKPNAELLHTNMEDYLFEITGLRPQIVVENWHDLNDVEKGKKKRKMTKAGQACRKCNTPVIKKYPKSKIKEGQKYRFEYYLSCPSCKTLYHVEEAKIFM
ncbi:MAG: hypothetical protein ABJN95_10175 [Maribacter sp.]|uniref:hypothetical protein n=1 Tax=Maribacter sp. TaxID=1897614 RepID=UPI0032987EF5